MLKKIIGKGTGFSAVEIPFNPQAKKLLEKSLYSSNSVKFNYIGPEHILLGIVNKIDGITHTLFKKIKVEPAIVRSKIL